MKSRSIAALCLVAVLAAVVAASTPGATKKATANSITVWLQVDAQSGWPDVVAAATKQFQSDHPGTSVNVQYQNWGDHLQKFDATLAGGSGPDVIEMGNTEMTKYMAAGAFADISSARASFDNSANWLKGLAASARYGGKTYGVPYYAGSRVVTYRTDLYKKAGISKLPATTAQYVADAKKLAAKNGKKGFSPVYIAGTDWYVAMGFVFDYGGGIATQISGKWKGLLSSPQSIAGLTAYKNFFNRHVSREQDDGRDASEPVRRVRTGPGSVDRRPQLVQLLRRREVQGLDRAVRDAGPRQGQGHARASSAAPTSRFPPTARTRRLRPTGSRTSPAPPRRRRCRRRATSRTRPTCSARASTSGPRHAAGSSRRRSTGSTSRTATCCATCSLRS